jgi:hypothetical protein
MRLEIVMQLLLSQDHHIQQLLDLRVACLHLGKYLTDEVHMPLNPQDMSFLLSLYYDHDADHLGGCGT